MGGPGPGCHVAELHLRERERARDSSRDWMQIESKLFLFGRRGTFQLCSPRAFFHYKLFLLHKLRRTK